MEINVIEVFGPMNADDQIATGFEREKWHIERAFRERELAIKEGELGPRRKEQAGSGWRKSTRGGHTRSDGLRPQATRLWPL